MKNILVIGVDSNLFSKESTDTYKRQISYSKKLKQLTIIVYTKGKYDPIIINNLKIIPSNSKNFFLGFFDMINIIRKFKKNGDKYDVISSQDPFFLGLIGLFSSILFKGKFKPQLHIEAYTNKYWKRESIINYIQYLIGFFVIKKAYSLRVVSKRCENHFKLKKRVNFIPVSTNINQFSHKSPKKIKKDLDIITITRLVPQKNLFFFIDLISELKLIYPNISVGIIGDGELKSKLLNYIKEKNLINNIILFGNISHEKISEYLCHSKVFVLPSLYEGWGLVCIEASLSGVPVVMSKTGCAGSVIINNKSGLVCEINDLNQFKTAIIKYIEKKNLREKHLIEVKKIISEKYGDKLLIDKLLKFLNN